MLVRFSVRSQLRRSNEMLLGRNWLHLQIASFRPRERRGNGNFSLSSGWKILVHIDRGGSIEMLFHSLRRLIRHLPWINSPCEASPSTENIKNMNHELVKFFALFTLCKRSSKLREKSPRRVGGVGMIDESLPCWRSAKKKLSRDADKRVRWVNSCGGRSLAWSWRENEHRLDLPTIEGENSNIKHWFKV